jgi:hypothetical protein
VPNHKLYKNVCLANTFSVFQQIVMSQTNLTLNYKRFGRWCIILCGDGFMDFVHRPKSEILKILKN